MRIGEQPRYRLRIRKPDFLQLFDRTGRRRYRVDALAGLSEQAFEFPLHRRFTGSCRPLQ